MTDDSTNSNWKSQGSGMSEDNYRSIGAILGLALGIGLMTALSFTGMVAGAIFGAGGCVAGAIAAEKYFAWKQPRDR